MKSSISPMKRSFSSRTSYYEIRKEIIKPERCLLHSTIIVFFEFTLLHPVTAIEKIRPRCSARLWIGWEEDGHNLINPDSRVQFDCVNPLRRAKVMEETRFSRKRKLEASVASIAHGWRWCGARGGKFIQRVHDEARIRDNGNVVPRIATSVLSLPNFPTDFRPSFSVSGWRLERRSQ